MHVIQHVPFEGPAAIAEWAAERRHDLTTSLALLEEHPSPEDIDLLVVMGGPMDCRRRGRLPVASRREALHRRVIAAGRPVLGVCLGAQILAEVLGGTVRRNEHPEIGWYPVERTTGGRSGAAVLQWDGPVIVGQWHGDTFELPVGIEPSLSSEVCANQAFVFDGRVVGLQFHLEWTEAALRDLIAECADELAVWDPFVMTAERILRGAYFNIPECRQRLFALLDDLEAIGAGEPGDGGRIRVSQFG